MRGVSFFLTLLLILSLFTQLVPVAGQKTPPSEDDYNTHFNSDLHFIMIESENKNITDIEIFSQIYLLELQMMQSVPSISSIFSISSIVESANRTATAMYMASGDNSSNSSGWISNATLVHAAANISTPYGLLIDDQQRINQIVGLIPPEVTDVLTAKDPGFGWSSTIIQLRIDDSEGSKSVKSVKEIVSSYSTTTDLHISFVDDPNNLEEKFSFNRVSCVMFNIGFSGYGLQTDYQLQRIDTNANGIYPRFYHIVSGIDGHILDETWNSTMTLWGENRTQMFVSGEQNEFGLIYIYHDGTSDEIIAEMAEQRDLGAPILLYAPTPEKSFLDFLTPTLISAVIGMGVLIGIIAVVWIRKKT